MADEMHTINLNYRKQGNPIRVVQAPPVTFAAANGGITPQGIAAGLALSSIFMTRLATSSMQIKKGSSFNLKSTKTKLFKTETINYNDNIKIKRPNIKINQKDLREATSLKYNYNYRANFSKPNVPIVKDTKPFNMKTKNNIQLANRRLEAVRARTREQLIINPKEISNEVSFKNKVRKRDYFSSKTQLEEVPSFREEVDKIDFNSRGEQ